jgi:hypothetical protein
MVRRLLDIATRDGEHPGIKTPNTTGNSHNPPGRIGKKYPNAVGAAACVIADNPFGEPQNIAGAVVTHNRLRIKVPDRMAS